ncbi:hypothetical protein GALMADRAFT_232735 [Galerina marginata CBS 339.88]|uniref:F-box domain-containing protein n=1 Tax=Galerina marginata (strain CBS 339.88) TaxID=685588 RepID=A0A067SH03_GALM3|nr:hypothetical protein GALMADRAFT_232735 [Galerina marginata CBS 339.88]
MASSVDKSLPSISPQRRQHFPQELIDLLIEYIHQGAGRHEARKALEACTLVSHSFSAKSRQYLLSTIVISDRIPSLEVRRQRLENLSILVESKSDFCALIRKVDIQVESQTLLDSASGLGSVFGALASHAKNLETFWITGDNFFPISWPHGGQSVARPLNNLLGSLKLRYLRISSMSDLPTDIFMQCPSARSFQLLSTTFNHAENTSYQSISHPSSLRELDLRLCINNFRENRQLLLVPNDLVVLVQPGSPAESIDISRLPKLVDLRFNVHIWTDKVMPSMEEIFVLLTRTTCPSQLRSIKIELSASVWAPQVLRFFENGDSAWTKHPSLQSVSVKLYLTVNLPPRHPGVIKEDIARSLRSTLISLILPPPCTSMASALNVDVVVR